MAEDISNNNESNSDQPESESAKRIRYEKLYLAQLARIANDHAQEEKANQFALYTAGLIALIVGVATIISGGSGITDFAWKHFGIGNRSATYVSREQFEVLKKETSALSKQIDQLRKIDTTTKSESVDYNKLNASVEALSSRIDLLEKAILDSPEKALTIPLMRKDLDNYTLSQTTRLNDLAQNLSSSIGQVYTVIGSVTVVIGLGFIGFAAASRSTKSDKKE